MATRITLLHCAALLALSATVLVSAPSQAEGAKTKKGVRAAVAVKPAAFRFAKQHFTKAEATAMVEKLREAEGKLRALAERKPGAKLGAAGLKRFRADQKKIKEVEGKLKEARRKLAAAAKKMRDSAQMSALSLQNTLDHQQKVMQTLSSMMKSQHETAKSIIGNMR